MKARRTFFIVSVVIAAGCLNPADEGDDPIQTHRIGGVVDSLALDEAVEITGDSGGTVTVVGSGMGLDFFTLPDAVDEGTDYALAVTAQPGTDRACYFETGSSGTLEADNFAAHVSCGDGVEPNNDSLAATVIDLDANNAAPLAAFSLHKTTDEDWFALVLGSDTQPLDIETSDTAGGGCELDTALELYDEAGNAIDPETGGCGNSGGWDDSAFNAPCSCFYFNPDPGAGGPGAVTLYLRVYGKVVAAGLYGLEVTPS